MFYNSSVTSSMIMDFDACYQVNTEYRWYHKNRCCDINKKIACSRFLLYSLGRYTACVSRLKCRPSNPGRGLIGEKKGDI